MNQFIVDFLSEFLGTFILVYVVFKTGNYLAIGATLAVLVFLTVNISLSCFNPAITIALYYNNKINMERLLIVLFAELLGALLTIPLLKSKII
jgi:glycerol uptake facilitator-like aquaporin